MTAAITYDLSPWLLFALGLVILLLLVISVVLLRIAVRVKWIKAKLEDSPRSEQVAVVEFKKEKTSTDYSAFEEFLKEDRSRQLMTKREQSAAFREWRRQRGVTWGTEE